MLINSLAILTAVSFVLTFWRWTVSLRFPLHRRIPVPASLPGLTLLKPLKGCDAETKNCLRSWFLQNYPGPVQILLGVASANDPVCVVARELLAEFPHMDARLVICAEDLGANAKVSTLRQLEPQVRHPLIMISDADVKVAPDFAANMTPLLANPRAGLVNCFYCLANPVTTAMQWEAVAMNADFWTNVLQSRSLLPVDFAMGAVMTLSVSQLNAIGGFAAFSDFLADDYQLGRRVAADGKVIEFATVVAECWDPTMDWGQVWLHQSRWARTIRACQPVPYLFSVLNNSSLWPMLWLAVARQPVVLAACGVCVLFRIGTAFQQQSRLTQKRSPLAYAWMPVVKDLLEVVIWCTAFAGNHILWRGQRYRILQGGRLSKA